MRHLFLFFLPLVLFSCTQVYTVHSAYVESFKGNTRLSITTDAETPFLAKLGADEIVLGFPRNTRFAVEASEVIRSFDTLCTYKGRKQAENLFLVFICEDDVEVHPEIREGCIDLIFTKKAAEF